MLEADQMDLETTIARWVHRFSIDQAPAGAIGAATLCIADVMGVAHAGSRTETYGLCSRTGFHQGGCTVIGTGATADAPSAAYLNAVASHVLDFDDTSYAGIVHGSAVILPAVLAVAEEIGANGRQLLEAFICAAEVEYTLGLALTETLYARGHWTTATLGILGATVGACKLYGLGVEEVANAIRLSMNIPLGLRATHGSTGKPFLCGMAARLGVEMALAAKAGIAGSTNTTHHAFGFINTVNGGRFHEDAIAGLGTRFALISPGIAFKLYPLCSATQAAIEATLMIATTLRPRVADIVRIRCRTTPLAASCLPYLEPTAPSEAQFSMTFAIACALLYGPVSINHLNMETLRDERLRVLMTHIEMIADAELVDPRERADYPEGDSVEITLANGERYSETILAAEGMPQKPASIDTLCTKFKDCTAQVLEASGREALWDRLMSIASLPEARDLLRPAAHA